MAEGEGRGDNKEELFEDLDKFFAPIQDVEWPEPEGPEPVAEPRARDTHVEVHAAEPSADPPAPSHAEGPGTADTGILDELLGDESDEPEAPSTPGQAAIFDVEPDAIAEPDPEGEDVGVALVDESGQPLTIEVPSETELDAAADHFAGSVNAEAARVNARDQIDTQEVALDVETVETVEAEEVTAEPTTEVEERLLADLDDRPETEPEPAPAPEPRTVNVSESLGGPSWQEPTQMEVGVDLEGRGGDRNLPAAVLTGVALAAIALIALAIDKVVFAIVASILILIAQGELYAAMHKRHYQPATAVGLASGALVLYAAYFKGEAAMLAMAAVAVAGAFLWFMTTPHEHRRDVLENVGLTGLPVVYVPMLAGYALVLVRAPEGVGLVLAVVGLTFVYDTSAFLIGSFWGNRPLAPNISPKKSWEGVIGATLVTAIVAAGLVAATVDPLSGFARSLGLGLVVAVFAPLGDLAESMIKRDLQIKDMGSILPGHGGVLDRIDSLLFVVPAAVLYFRIIF